MKKYVGVQCITLFLVLILNLVIGAWSVNYLLLTFLGKVIPVWGAALIGLFVAEVSFPVAAVVWLLKLFGVF